MINILKEKPVTAYGRDFLEILVQDFDMPACVACDLCAYRDWRDSLSLDNNCCTVHGCTMNANTYFIISEL